jgi:aldose 1-epimerase
MRTLTLAAGDLEADFVPEAGMVGCSLRHRGAELLGQRGGLDAYVSERKTMGIPLLHPWANRLSQRRFTLLGREVSIDPERTPVRLDGSGLPMHGLLSAVAGWEPVEVSATRIAAVFDFAAHEALVAAFPFPHELRLEATLSAETLTVALTVRATGDTPVPIAFGFHPYLQLPDVPRDEWVAEIPVTEHLSLDDDMIPTGERAPVSIEPGPLGDRTFDDAYTAPSAPFALSGGGRRIELSFLEGFPYSQVFAPSTDALIAFEPMTAPTNALVSGGDQLPVIGPGEHYRAAFSISMRSTP